MATPLQKRKLMGDINVVPYIDVMLVLLVIFMVTAPLLTQGIEVELPKAGAEPIESAADKLPLILSVDQAGNLYLSVGDDEDEPDDRGKGAFGAQEQPRDADPGPGGPLRRIRFRGRRHGPVATRRRGKCRICNGPPGYVPRT